MSRAVILAVHVGGITPLPPEGTPTGIFKRAATEPLAIGLDALSRFVAEQGIASWYYRVLAGGTVAPGDPFELVERNPQPLSLRRLWSAHLAHRPDPEELARLRATPGLSPNWVRKLGERLDWLRRHGPTQ